MATAAVLPPPSASTYFTPTEIRPFPSPIPFVKPRRADFEPSKHLSFSPPTSCYTFDDLGLPPSPLSPLAVTAPFPLFTPEGVRELRRDVLSRDSIEKYGVSSAIAAFQTREHSVECAPFAHQVFSHPQVLAAISSAAGIELVPVMEIEKTHVNIQVSGVGGASKLRFLGPDPSPATPLSEEELAEARLKADADFGNGDAVVREHVDAYPFVCVAMLSDVSQMVGGETAIRCGDGSMIKARGPQVGSVVVMQGRYVRHVGLKAYNSPERITMVCSFRARDPMLPDDSALRGTIHPVSRTNRLNFHWATYRLRLLSERFAIMAAQLEAKKAALGPKNDADGKGGAEVVVKPEFEAWIESQVAYLQATVNEMM